MSRNSFENAKRRLNGLPGALQRACFAAMGRTLSHSKTVLSREIRSEYSIKAKTACRAISAKRVKGSGSTSAEIRVRGPNLFASEFAMRPRTDTTGAKRREVRLGIRKTGLKAWIADLLEKRYCCRERLPLLTRWSRCLARLSLVWLPMKKSLKHWNRPLPKPLNAAWIMKSSEFCQKEQNDIRFV